jgi:mannose-6-phosphate isomerase-like protein (cupin superfamily)
LTEAPEKAIFNPVTGLKLDIVRSAGSTGGELLEMVATYPPGSGRPPVHFHPRQEERFLILEGAMKASIEGQTRVLATGDELTLPAGTLHTMWNPGPGRAVVRWQTRPALQTQRFFETIFSLAERGRLGPTGRPKLLDLAVIVPRHWQEMRVTKPSPFAQRLLFTFLGPFARLLGRG